MNNSPLFQEEIMACPFKSKLLNNTSNILLDKNYTVHPKNETVPKALQGLFIGNIFNALMRMNDGDYHFSLKTALINTLKNFDKSYIQQKTAQIIEMSHIVIDSPESLTDAIQTWPIMVIAEAIGLEKNDQLIQHIKNFILCLSNPDVYEYIHLGNASAQWLYQNIKNADGILKQKFINHCSQQNIYDPFIINSNLMGLFFQTFDGTGGLIGLKLINSDLLSIKNTRRFLNNQIIILPLNDAKEALPFGLGEHHCPGELWAKTIAQKISEYLTELPNTSQWITHYQWKNSANANVPLFISKGETL